MKKLDIGQTVSIVANIGVIAGIVFLGVELRQNNELMEADARFNYVTFVVNAWSDLAFNTDYVELRNKAARGEALSEAENRQLDAALMRIFTQYQWVFGEFPEGSPQRVMQFAVAKRQFEEEPVFLRVWNDRKSAFNDEFVRFIDEEIVRAE